LRSAVAAVSSRKVVGIAKGGNARSSSPVAASLAEEEPEPQPEFSLARYLLKLFAEQLEVPAAARPQRAGVCPRTPARLW
jgi:hypothetical protein